MSQLSAEDISLLHVDGEAWAFSSSCKPWRPTPRECSLIEDLTRTSVKHLEESFSQGNRFRDFEHLTAVWAVRGAMNFSMQEAPFLEILETPAALVVTQGPRERIGSLEEYLAAIEGRTGGEGLQFMGSGLANRPSVPSAETLASAIANSDRARTLSRVKTDVVWRVDRDSCSVSVENWTPMSDWNVSTDSGLARLVNVNLGPVVSVDEGRTEQVGSRFAEARLVDGRRVFAEGIDSAQARSRAVLTGALLLGGRQFGFDLPTCENCLDVSFNLRPISGLGGTTGNGETCAWSRGRHRGIDVLELRVKDGSWVIFGQTHFVTMPVFLGMATDLDGVVSSVRCSARRVDDGLGPFVLAPSCGDLGVENIAISGGVQ